MVESYFVRIPDSKSLRLALLESIKANLNSSKHYLDLARIRLDKSKLLNEFKDALLQLQKDFLALESSLPHQELKKLAKPAVKKSSSKKKTLTSKYKQPLESKSLSKEERQLKLLEESLSKIEEKINSL